MTRDIKKAAAIDVFRIQCQNKLASNETAINRFGSNHGNRPLSEEALSTAIKAKADQLGFDHCHLTPITTAPHADFFDGWVDLGRPGEMTYLARNGEKRRDPRLLVDDDVPALQSIIVLAVNYHQFDLPADLRDDPSRGLIAAYAWGDDYHEIIRPLLHKLDAFIRAQSGRTTQGKCLVDTGPVLERDWAERSGLGFTGKNCCTIHPAPGTGGSWLILATIMVPETLSYDPAPISIEAPKLAPDAILNGLPPNQSTGAWAHQINNSPSTIHNSPLKTATCGQCTRCLDACPTNAFIGPFHLDPQRCISYWTIESRQAIPRELRPLFGNRIFGCDICQEVCPWNRRLDERTPRLPGLHAQSERVAPPLLEGFDPATPYWLDQTAFSTRFRRSPVKRAKRRGVLRNVCVALGNWADPSTVAPLCLALHDPEPLARGHAAWALGQVIERHNDVAAVTALTDAARTERDPWVLEEIQLSLTAR